MDFSRNYTMSLRLMRINPETWSDEDLGPSISSASIMRKCDDGCSKLESSTMSVSVDVPSRYTFPTGWYRIEADVRNDSGERQREALATHYIQSTRGDINHKYANATLAGDSVLLPASIRSLVSGKHVPKGTNAVEYVVDLLESCLKAPVTVSGNGFVIDDHYVFDPGTSYLQAAWDILGLGGWCMQVNGYGIVTIRAKPETPRAVFDRSSRNIIVPGISYEDDLSGIPNHYVAIGTGGEVYEVFNNQKNSRTSTVARNGMIQDYVDLAPMPINSEGYDGYVRRRLMEESTVYKTFSYSREYISGLYPFDVISMQLLDDGMVGNMRIMSQTIDCAGGINVSESVSEEIVEYSG